MPCLCDVTRHGEVDLALIIIQVQGEAYVFAYFPILCDVAVPFQNADEVFCMLLSLVFDSEIVND